MSSFHPPADARRSRAGIAALILAWALLTALAWDLPLNNDVAWQYWVARQVLGGARLYRDIVESNPPLWFWEAMPLTRAADAIGIDPAHLAIAAVMARIVAAAALAGALVGRGAGRHRTIAAAILILAGGFSFGERDVLMAVGGLPYALLIARRAAGAPTAPSLAVAVAGLAGWGFAMKPHFVLVPILLDLWLGWRLRRQWRIARPETVTIALLAAAYLVAIRVATPAYITDQLPLVLSAYADFKPPFATLWAGQVYAPVWVLGGAALLAAARLSPSVAAAAVNATACLAIYAVQGKGFPYHAAPVTIAVTWAAWLLLADERRLAARMLAWLTLFAAALIVVLVGPFRPSRLAGITTAVEALPPGATFALVSAHSWDAFPLVERRRLVWPMRGLLLWTLPSVARTGEDGPLARRVRAEIVADLWCHPPDAILFDDPRRSPAMPHIGRGTGFDYRRFVLADPAAATLLNRYRLTARTGGATLWRRTGPVAPRGTGCRAISIRPATTTAVRPVAAIRLFRAPAPDTSPTASPPAG